MVGVCFKKMGELLTRGKGYNSSPSFRRKPESRETTVNRTYLKIGFLFFSRHSGLDPESSGFAVSSLKTKSCEVPHLNAEAAGYRLQFTPYRDTGPV